MNKNIKLLLLPLLSIPCLFGCNNADNKDIVILYTTDVHCGIDNHIGYASLQSYRKEMEKTNHVSLIDAGDAISGDFIGSISDGEYIIDIMNELNYDFMVLGNHEFDYGMSTLKNCIDNFKGDILSCNFKYIGNKENLFPTIKSYKVIDYGGRKVGFVGVTTPLSITSSTPSNFMEDDKFAYTFSNETDDGFINCIQDSINACYSNKADYVVLVSHLGYNEVYSPYTSYEVMSKLNGVCAVLDGHAHKDVENTFVKDKDNKDIPILDAGYQMNEFGKLTISSKGEIKTELIKQWEPKDPEASNFIDCIKEKVESKAKQVLATSDLELKILDEYNIRMSRNQEIPLGNLVADAYRCIGEAQIGIVNGGGIRTGLPKGDLTYEVLKAIHPFGNKLSVVEATGQQLLDYLEFANMKVQKEYYKVNDDGSRTALGEFGGFAQVSGIKFEVDTSIPTGVVVDDNGMFVRIDGNRRVKNVQIYIDNQYVPIDINKTYSLASHDYLLYKAGDGANMFQHCKVLVDQVALDYEVVVRYIVDVLQGHLSEKYSSTEGRIVKL